jgi:hypothetical protein
MMAAAKKMRCAIYTRVSTDAGLDQDFNSLDAQYDAAQAYIRSQVHATDRLLIYSGNPYLPLIAQDLNRHVIAVPPQQQVDGRLT